MTYPTAIYAACEALSHTTATFTVEQIAVACWRADPAKFGMRSFENAHPDLRKVVSVLAGTRGMVQHGQLVKAGPGLYSLGKPLAKARQKRVPQSSVKRRCRYRDADFIGRLAAANASFKIGTPNKITRLDALEFFGLRYVQALTAEACDQCIARLGEIEEAGTAPEADVRYVRNVAVLLRDKFCGEVKS